MYPKELISNASSYLQQQQLDCMRPHILITGATGYVGSWLLSVLTESNFRKHTDLEISAITRNSELAKKKFAHAQYSNVNWVEMQADHIHNLLPIYTHVIHAATPTTPHTGSLVHENVYKSSKIGIESIVELSKRSKDPIRILHTSSGAVYKNAILDSLFDPDANFNINDPKLKSRKHDFYSKVKVQTENILNSATQKGDAIGLNARLFSFYGPGISTRGEFAIGKFISDAIKNKRISIEASGDAIRSYMAGSDLAAQIIYLLFSPINNFANICGKEPKKMIEWAELIANIIPSEIEIKNNFDDSSDIYSCVPDKRIPNNLNALEDQQIFSIWEEYLVNNQTYS